MKDFFNNKKLWAVAMMLLFAGCIVLRASRFFDGPVENEKKFYHIFWIILFGIGFFSNLVKFITLSKRSESTEQIVNDKTEQVS